MNKTTTTLSTFTFAKVVGAAAILVAEGEIPREEFHEVIRRLECDRHQQDSNGQGRSGRGYTEEEELLILDWGHVVPHKKKEALASLAVKIGRSPKCIEQKLREMKKRDCKRH